MDSHKPVLGLFVAIIALMLAGEALVYVSDPYDYSSELNGNEYCVYSSASADFGILQFSEQHLTENICIYYDGDYSSPAGVSKAEIKELQREFELRGMDAETADADEITEIILNRNPSEYTLVFTDGGLPDTVYSGNSSDLIFQWFDNGGSVAWMGHTIGKYVCTEEGTEEIGDVRYSLFFPPGTVNENPYGEYATVPDSGLGKKLCVRSSECTFGLSDSPGVLSLGYVSESGYCSAALTEFGHGRLLIVGGTYGDTERTDLAQIVSAGLTAGSVLVSEHYEHCHGNTKKGMVDNLPGTGVYIFCGGDYTCYGKGYLL